MMNRYVPDGKGYRRIVVEEPQNSPAPPFKAAPEQTVPAFQPAAAETPAKQNIAAPTTAPRSELREKIGSDLVLLLVLALAFVDGDELDLAITLALILILGL